MTRSAWASSARGTWARASRAASQRRASSGPPPSAPRPAAPSAAPPSPPSVPPSSPPTPSDVIVISVKPQIVKQVLVELKPLLSEEKLLVSIVVGIKMKDLQRGLVQRVEEDLQHICPGGGDTMVLGAHAGILLDLPWCTSNFQLTGEGTITLKFKLRVQKLDKLYADMAMQKELKILSVSSSSMIVSY